MLLERDEAAMRIGNEPELQPVRRERTECGRDVVVEKEVLTLGPFLVDFAGAGVEPLARSAHALDHAAGVADEDVGGVDMILLLIEDGRGRQNGSAEQPRVDGNAVAGAEAGVPFALECRTRIDEREVDVEEDAANRWVHASVPSNGPATTMAARDTSSVRGAAGCTTSRVTARRRSGNR